MKTRTLQQIIPAVPTADGAGVRLRRSLGRTPVLRLDPFLMLDAFSSENPDDYIAGFPPHPHRGFETVTYMLEGQFVHEDDAGHRGVLRSGGVQWMTAGRGIVHSEMPQQEQGRMRGFQLWINLPAREKMKPAAYRNVQAEEIPVMSLPGEGRVRVVAGMGKSGADTFHGPIRGLATDPLFLDVHLPAEAPFDHPVTAGHNALVYVYEGGLHVGDDRNAVLRPVRTHEAGVLAKGDRVRVRAGPDGVDFLLLAARPLGEPVVQYGPFVMNTREEIEQALHDYRYGNLAS